MKYSINFDSFSEEELQQWVANLAEHHNKQAGNNLKVVNHNNKAHSGFQKVDNELPENFKQNIDTNKDN